MPRYIDADALILKLKTQDYSGAPDTLEDWTPQDMTNAEISDIEHAPTADVRENIHAKWVIEKEIVNGVLHAGQFCSNCDYPQYLTTKFCPNCGALMDEGKNGWFDSFDWLTIREEAIE